MTTILYKIFCHLLYNLTDVGIFILFQLDNRRLPWAILLLHPLFCIFEHQFTMIVIGSNDQINRPLRFFIILRPKQNDKVNIHGALFIVRTEYYWSVRPMVFCTKKKMWILHYLMCLGYLWQAKVIRNESGNCDKYKWFRSFLECI